MKDELLALVGLFITSNEFNILILILFTKQIFYAMLYAWIVKTVQGYFNDFVLQYKTIFLHSFWIIVTLNLLSVVIDIVVASQFTLEEASQIFLFYSYINYFFIMILFYWVLKSKAKRMNMKTVIISLISLFLIDSILIYGLWYVMNVFEYSWDQLFYEIGLKFGEKTE